MPYALFDRDERVGEPMPTELEVWKRALEAGLISDIPVADEEGGQVLPPGLHVKKIDEAFDPRPDWKVPGKSRDAQSASGQWREMTSLPKIALIRPAPGLENCELRLD
jgi:hypothetical protein